MEKLLEAVKNLINSSDDTGCDGLIVVGLDEFEALEELYGNLTQ